MSNRRRSAARPGTRPAVKRVQVALAVIERGDRILVCRRRRGSHLAGYWEFPGGKRRPGERWVDCAAREAREELGVEVRIAGSLAQVRFRYPDRWVLLRGFRCRIVRGTPRSRSGESIRWVSRNQLTRLKLPHANGPILTELRRGPPSCYIIRRVQTRRLG